VVTFKDLQKFVGSQAGPEQTQILQGLGDKEFGIGIRLHTKRKISVQKAVAVSSTRILLSAANMSNKD
jgi:hypothetical protein